LALEAARFQMALILEKDPRASAIAVADRTKRRLRRHLSPFDRAKGRLPLQVAAESGASPEVLALLRQVNPEATIESESIATELEAHGSATAGESAALLARPDATVQAAAEGAMTQLVTVRLPSVVLARLPSVYPLPGTELTKGDQVCTLLLTVGVVPAADDLLFVMR